MPIIVPDANSKAFGRFAVEEKAVLIQTAIAAADRIDGTRIVIVFFFLVGSLAFTGGASAPVILNLIVLPANLRALFV
jgi:hypothetical protein